MIEIIPGIKAVLSRSLSQARDQDIRETGDERALPKEISLPAVMIKDGGTATTELAGGRVRKEITVNLILWTEVYQEGSALTGTGNTIGILSLENAIWKILDENNLGIAGVISAVRATSVPPSEPWNNGNKDLQRLKVSYIYTKEEDRPSQA